MASVLEIVAMLAQQAKEAKVAQALRELHATPGATALPRDLSTLPTRRADMYTGKQVPDTADFYTLHVKDPKTGGEARGSVQHLTSEDMLDLYGGQKSVMGQGAREAMFARANRPVTNIDTVGLNRNGSGGVFYPVAYHDDLQNGRRNMAVSLSSDNQARRTSQMLNSGLREGTLQHIILNPEQQRMPVNAKAFYEMSLPEQIAHLSARERMNVAQDFSHYQRTTGEKLRAPPVGAPQDDYDATAKKLHGLKYDPASPITSGESTLRRAALFDYLTKGGATDALPPEMVQGLFKARGGLV